MFLRIDYVTFNFGLLVIISRHLNTPECLLLDFISKLNSITTVALRNDHIT